MASDDKDLEAVESLVDATETDEPKVTAFGGVQPETPAQAEAKKSRKQAALDRQAKAEAEKAALDERFARLEGGLTSAAQREQELRNEIARLQGIASVRVPAAPIQQGPSSDDLYRQATKALDDKDYTEYHRLMREGFKADAAAIAEAKVAALQAQIPDPRQFQQQQADPQLAAAIRHVDRNLNLTPRLAELPEDMRNAKIDAEARVLLLDGHPPGPATLTKAMQNCEARITGKTRPSFSPSNRMQIDRHVNSGGSENSAEDVGTEAQRAQWKRFGLPENEFKKYA